MNAYVAAMPCPSISCLSPEVVALCDHLQTFKVTNCYQFRVHPEITICNFKVVTDCDHLWKPQRGCSLQPSVGATRLRWVNGQNEKQL